MVTFLTTPCLFLQVRQLEQQVVLLRDSLQVERDAAAATIAVARSEFSAKSASQVGWLLHAC